MTCGWLFYFIHVVICTRYKNEWFATLDLSISGSCSETFPMLTKKSVLASVVLAFVLTDESFSYDLPECKSGDRVTGECLQCICGPNGRYKCDIQGCNLPPRKSAINSLAGRSLQQIKLAPSCKTGDTFYDGCNVCGCQPGVGFVLCTRRFCFPDKVGIPTTTTATTTTDAHVKHCTPYKQWFDGCNWCTCLSNGLTEACTRRYCG